MKSFGMAAAVCMAAGMAGVLASHTVTSAPQMDALPAGSVIHHDAEVSVDSLADPVKRRRHAEKLFRLGNAYLTGKGVAQDNGEAFYYYRKAARLDNARAQISLVLMYADGRGTRKDFDEAVYWLHRASDLEQLSWHDAAISQAVYWLQEAAEHGYAPAQLTLEQMKNSGSCRSGGPELSVFCFGESVSSGSNA